MKKIFLLSLLFILLTTTAYGANFYSGIKFQNTATDEYIVSWTSTGNQFKWISADTIGAAMTATGADAVTVTAGFGSSINAYDLVVTGGVWKHNQRYPTRMLKKLFLSLGSYTLTSEKSIHRHQVWPISDQAIKFGLTARLMTRQARV